MPVNLNYLQTWLNSVAEGVQVAQHLRQAALQQQQLDEVKRARLAEEALRTQEAERRAAMDQVNLLSVGARPVDDGTVSMPMQTPGPLYGLPGAGDQFETQNARVPVAQGRTVNFGGRSYEIPTLDERLQQEVERTQALEGAKRVPFRDILTPTPDTMVNPHDLSGVAATMRATTPPVQLEKPSIHISTDDGGRQVAVYTYPDGRIEEKPLKSRGKSKSTGEGGLTANGQAVQERFNERQVEHRQETIDKLQAQEQEQHTLREQYGQQLNTPNGEVFVDEKGKEVEMTPGMREFVTRKFKKATDAVGRLQRTQRRILGQPEQKEAGQPATKARAQTAAAPRYKVGDVVTSQGKQYRIMGINPDGSIKAQAL